MGHYSGNNLLGGGAERARSPRVLLVDDDTALARVLRRSLTLLGLDVTVADSGHSAMDQLGATQFDVVLLDLQMPDMNGLDMLRLASARFACPATILHSAYVDVPTTVEAMQAGAREVLQKPTSAADLARRIFAIAQQAPDRSPREPLPSPAQPELLLGDSPSMQQVRAAIRRVARFHDLAVLIEGPTGTGKELVARSIHQLSAPGEPIVSINCAAIPSELFESELFGHDAGAFTSARGARMGLLEEAGRGVLFLDEVGELPQALQAKLLRVLETREFRRVGSGRTRRFAARLVSATNRRLGDGTCDDFRADLYFRIAGHTIRTPPLCDHASDIPLLVQHFRDEFCARHKLPSVTFTPAAMDHLCEQPFPGNVRQLRATVHGAIVAAQTGTIELAQLAGLMPDPEPARAPAAARERGRRQSGARPKSLPDLEREVILTVYHEAGRNLTHAAEQLGIPRTTLRDRLKRYGVR